MIPKEMSYSRVLSISQIASSLETLADVMVSDRTDHIAGFEESFWRTAGIMLRILLKTKTFDENKFLEICKNVDNFDDLASEWLMYEDRYRQLLARQNNLNDKEREQLASLPEILKSYEEHYQELKTKVDAEVTDVIDLLNNLETKS